MGSFPEQRLVIEPTAAGKVEQVQLTEVEDSAWRVSNKRMLNQ